MLAPSASSDRFRHFCEEKLLRDFEASPKPEKKELKERLNVILILKPIQKL
jgi:hypothetical protein